MEYKIIIKIRFRKKVVRLLEYLEAEWGKTVADNFNKELNKRITTLSVQPFIGILCEKVSGVRSILITKHNRVYYRINESTIEILNMYDTRINPKKNLFKDRKE